MSTPQIIFAALTIFCLLGVASAIDTTNKQLKSIDAALWAIWREIKDQGERNANH